MNDFQAVSAHFPVIGALPIACRGPPGGSVAKSSRRVLVDRLASLSMRKN